MAGGYEVDNDEADAYRTMDSGSTDSSLGRSQPQADTLESMRNVSNEENNGVEIIEDHARRNLVGLEAMIANNEFIETVQTTQQWDAKEKFDNPVVNIVSSTESNIPTELYECQIFHSKEDLQDAINGWSIVQNVQYINSTLNKSRLTIVCVKHDNPHRPCLWRLHAARSKRLDGLWKVSTCSPPHT
ncbi:hypothetical protein M5K25_014615 [Dendrobium thyrsiflorum]|uniref:Transposase MuDR plant domain-containing protein n=1 Tax=Dendrobium thyrsiflorum TaxID=117978 RepID=A0ABD0UN88_DENTH